MIITDANGRETFLATSGSADAPPVLLLHGIGADHAMWQPQMASFAEAGFFVLAPDLLGHGQSAKVSSLTLGDWEAQINTILGHFGFDQCLLVGVSMGGVIAQSFAMNHPKKVARLVLSDTFSELKTTREKLLGFSQVVGFRLYKLLGGKMLAKGMASTYKAPFAYRAKEYFSQVSRDVDFDQLVLARKAINQIDALGRVDGNHIPTLVMVGDQFGESFVAINRKIADSIANAKFVVLPNAMDPSNLVNPEAFNAQVLAFLIA